MNEQRGPESIVENAPSYLQGKVRKIKPGGPSDLLINGEWCGHGEPYYRVFDIVYNGQELFKIIRPSVDDLRSGTWASVKLIDKEGNSFLAYDAARHPPGEIDEEKIERVTSETLRCTCGNLFLHVSVGFEVPGDSEGNDYISWFAITASCPECNERGFFFDHEAA